MKFLWLDEWYDAAWQAFLATGRVGYHEFCHGTSNYWDIVLVECGHVSRTLVRNRIENETEFQAWIDVTDPDVLCVQNVGRWPVSSLADRSCKKVAFVSYRATDADMVGWDVVFTSFPWLVPHLQKLGQRAELLPLAFGRPILDRVEAPPERDLPLTFVGGIGHRHIWDRGSETILYIAQAFPDTFKWWGYRPKELPSPLERTWRGEAWGADYFKILMRSRITLNRHGEIARGFTNNMRTFEISGCGACMLTEESCNIASYFKLGSECITYKSADYLVGLINQLLGSPNCTMKIGEAGRRRCLHDHTYSHRIEAFLDVIGQL